MVYHGTNLKHLPAIKSKGLISKEMGYDSPRWYMVATDFESALFHAMPDAKQPAIVIEFKVPVTNVRWDGNPYFWPPAKKEKSKWYALKQPLSKKFIKKIHRVSHEDWLVQKNKGF